MINFACVVIVHRPSIKKEYMDKFHYNTPSSVAAHEVISARPAWHPALGIGIANRNQGMAACRARYKNSTAIYCPS